MSEKITLGTNSKHSFWFQTPHKRTQRRRNAQDRTEIVYNTMFNAKFIMSD